MRGLSGRAELEILEVLGVMSPGSFVPKNSEFEAVVRESFARQSFMATLGASIVRLMPGEVDLRLPYSTALCQQNGYMHAGAIASVADSANGYAAYSLAPADTDVLAVEFKINLLAPAQGSHFVARGRVVRPGRTLTVCLAEVVAQGAQEVLIATMLSTIIIRPRTDVAGGAA